MLSEERQEMLAIARTLQAELQAHNKRVNHVINKLLSEADRTKMEVLAGVTEQPEVKQVTFTGRVDSTKMDEFVGNSVGMPKGKRACSLCRQPGHRAQNCPNAHIIQ